MFPVKLLVRRAVWRGNQHSQQIVRSRHNLVERFYKRILIIISMITNIISILIITTITTILIIIIINTNCQTSCWTRRMVQAGYPVEKFYSASAAAAADDYKNSETWRLRKFKKKYFKRTLPRQMSGLQGRLYSEQECLSHPNVIWTRWRKWPFQLWLAFNCIWTSCWKCWAIFKLYEDFSK